MAVKLHINEANVLRIFFLIAVALPKGIGKVEPQFVNSGHQWYVILEGPLILRHHQIGRNGLSHCFKQTGVGGRREKVSRSWPHLATFIEAIRFPTMPPRIDISASTV
jgi:hypothetical protein